MDPVLNPYAPGAGTPPPQLAGRSELLEQVRIALARIQRGLPARSVLMVGLRGVGKTVLLDRMRDDAESLGVQTIRIEAPEVRSLPALLAPQLRKALLRLSRHAKAKDMATRALRALAGFVGALKVKFNDIEVGLDVEAEPGLADTGDLELDLQELLEACGQAAKSAGTVLVMFIDELQYVKQEELAALITALHRCAQQSLPVAMAGAGLPQLRARMGDAKSYAERLFSFSELGPLDADASREALVVPANEQGVTYSGGAIAEIISQTRGYPYFLQEWGKYSWDVSSGSPIKRKDVKVATAETLAALDEGFFRVRFDRLTPTEKLYLRAMAELGTGPHRSGDIAGLLNRKVTSLAPTRNQLIGKGMIWSPGHGDTAFTVPLFDEFMKRIMPGRSWLEQP